jgi:hypothetical protein
MKSKKQVSIERRVFKHLRVPLSIDFRFMSRWNDPKAGKTIKGRAYDVSKEGLCLETEIDMRDGSLEFIETEGEEKLKAIPYLVSSEKKMRLELHLPLGTKGFVFRGKAIWYELKSEDPISMLRMGVLFRAMPQEARDRWVGYMETQVSSTLDNND